VNGCSKELKYEYVLRENNRSSGVRKSKSTKVDIPPGVDTGLTMKVAGQGEEGLNGKPPGDLYVSLEVASDSYFRREGADVMVDIPISITQAILGGSTEVLTLDGLVDLKIPAGTQPDSKLVMRGKGIRRLDNSARR
jgi:molecular chaperone DnaJ